MADNPDRVREINHPRQGGSQHRGLDVATSTQRHQEEITQRQRSNSIVNRLNATAESINRITEDVIAANTIVEKK
jgi:hypothetical protein